MDNILFSSRHSNIHGVFVLMGLHGRQGLPHHSLFERLQLSKGCEFRGWCMLHSVYGHLRVIFCNLSHKE